MFSEVDDQTDYDVFVEVSAKVSAKGDLFNESVPHRTRYILAVWQIRAGYRNYPVVIIGHQRLPESPL